MAKRDNRGRRRIYRFADRKRMADLVREHGARGAREALERQTCLATLLVIAREFKVELRKGRRPRKAA